MPELPEVESARSVIAENALGRRIADVDDRDTYETRPHSPGELRDALVGRTLTDVHRRGKLMYAETSDGGPLVALHLGMAGRIFVTGADGEDREGGDYNPASSRGGTNHKPEWDRFTITFDDGGTLRLFDKRRLGRVYLDPDVDKLGPDAGEVGVAEFREIVGRSAAPLKARIMDQHAVAGVGNLLADEALWQAELGPARPSDELSKDELTTLHRELRKAIRAAIKKGGVHTGKIIPFRKKGAHCPRCGAEMVRSTVGGRTTWSCSREQVS